MKQLLLILLGVVAITCQAQADNVVRLVLKVDGDAARVSRVAVRWGHNDFHEHEFFSRWDVSAEPRGTATQQKTFTIPGGIENTEFEVQTEGGPSYTLTVYVNDRLALTRTYSPSKGTALVNHGVVAAERSSRFNPEGEGNIRVYFRRDVKAGSF